MKSSSAQFSLSPYWSELTTQDFARIDKTRAIAVLPLAATEQHGPHLSLSVDTDIVNGVVAASLGPLQTLQTLQASAESPLPVFFLPTQCVGLSPEHAAFVLADRLQRAGDRGQILLGRKFVDNWPVWVGVNVVSVALFARYAAGKR